MNRLNDETYRNVEIVCHDEKRNKNIRKIKLNVFSVILIVVISVISSLSISVFLSRKQLTVKLNCTSKLCIVVVDVDAEAGVSSTIKHQASNISMS